MAVEDGPRLTGSFVALGAMIRAPRRRCSRKLHAPGTAPMPQSWRIGNTFCHDGPMEPEEAEAAIRQAASEYASGTESPPVLWSAFGSHLNDLCRDGPLTGDYLRLFQSLEHWEQSVSPERERAEDDIRHIAANLGNGVPGGQVGEQDK